MRDITGFLLGIVGLCLIASIAKQFLNIGHQHKSLGNTIIGVFILFGVLSSISVIDWDADIIDGINITSELGQISDAANLYQQQALRQSIMAQTEAYIGNKARELSLEVDLEIALCEMYPYAPCGIRITGSASPYAKAQLSKYLTEEIGIPKEAQIWTSANS